MHTCGAQFQWIHVQNVSSTWGSGHITEDVAERQRARGSGIRGFAVRAHLLVTSGVTPAKSPQHDCSNVQWTRTTSMDMASWMGQSPRGFNPTKEPQATEDSWVRGGVSPREECTRWLSRVKWSALKSYMQVYIWEYICTYIYARSNNWWKRGHEFEGKQGMIYGEVWREEKEDRN